MPARRCHRPPPHRVAFRGAVDHIHTEHISVAAKGVANFVLPAVGVLELHPGGAAKSVTVLAAAAATTSEQGDYTATSLKPSAAWAAGSMSGEFTWSYPIAAPDVPGEVSPDLSIGYSSGGTDGGVSNTNNQASWVGEGFELGSAFIERKYAGCYDDRSGGTNSSSTASDLCWYTDSKKTNDQKWDNAFLSMAGHAGELVRIGNTAEWRLEVDDGTRVAKIGTAASNNEYWRVTTPTAPNTSSAKARPMGRRPRPTRRGRCRCRAITQPSRVTTRASPVRSCCARGAGTWTMWCRPRV